MRADKVHHEDSDAESGARTGPRHAAPKKPLLTRLQMPAGKAIALAAMPTAVLMGMGLTPTLAQAKPLPKNPFQDGPCVTQPDESPEDAAEKDAKAKDEAAKEDDKSDKADAEKDDADGKESEADEAKPSPSASASPSGSPKASTPSGSGTGSGGLLGGLGGVLGNILTPGQKESAPSSPSPSASSAADGGSAVDKVTDTVDKVTGSAKDIGDKVGETVDKVGEKAEDAVKPSPSASNPLAPDKDGKKPFPCVVEKKSAGTAEAAPVILPNQPWRLEASSLLLQGLDYKGVVNLTMADGRTKQVLKFTADDGIDIGDLHQLVDGPQGRTYHVRAAEGSTSTIRGGQVTMYTESLEGNLFGLIPITFDPEHPPPINLPVAYFTNVKLTQAGQFGGNLTVPGLHNFIAD